MSLVKVSAPGKLMLLGEHAVVYGYPAIVTAVNQRLHVTMEQINGDDDVIETPQVKESKFLSETLTYFRTKYSALSHLKIQTMSEFSHTMGFGSSSAVTVALLKALSLIYNVPIALEELFHEGYDIVLKVQGTGSGFDIAAAVYGKTLYYVKGGTTLEALELPSLPLIIGYSGVKADTTTLINHVKQQYETHKQDVQNIFTKIEQLVHAGRQHLLENNLADFGKLMTENHHLLTKLGVSTDKLDAMVQAALDAGAWGAKLSGAGGGDCMIALAPAESRQAVEDAIRQVGGEVVQISANADGVGPEQI